MPRRWSCIGCAAVRYDRRMRGWLVVTLALAAIAVAAVAAGGRAASVQARRSGVVVSLIVDRPTTALPGRPHRTAPTPLRAWSARRTPRIDRLGVQERAS